MPKTEGLTVCKFKEGGLVKKSKVVFFREVGVIDCLMHTMKIFAQKFDINNFTFNSFINIQLHYRCTPENFLIFSN